MYYKHTTHMVTYGQDFDIGNNYDPSNGLLPTAPVKRRTIGASYGKFWCSQAHGNDSYIFSAQPTSCGIGGWFGDSTLTPGHAGVFFALNHAEFVADAEL